MDHYIFVSINLDDAIKTNGTSQTNPQHFAEKSGLNKKRGLICPVFVV
jgi:hypothetical protein